MEKLVRQAANKKPLVIAGPCSAESEQQVMETARQLAAGGKTDIFRAGLWKPRTQPGSFEGVGEKGLLWLKQVKEAFQLPVATEVANAKHVAAALKSGIDVLWIGARTTTNPFAVQEIADALQGAGVAVLIKNPMVPDLSLWIGAIERIKKTGITNIGAVHRGFPDYRQALYRNQPLWQLPIELKQRLPELALICDPSHMGGKRIYLQEILQKAADLNYDGCMIEAHIHPDEALSDARQQITPYELLGLIDKIALRKADSSDSGFLDRLKELRREIDLLDGQLLDLLAQRMKIVEVIGQQKKAGGVTILQAQRRSEMMKKALEKAAALGFPEDFIKELFELIHQESINRQTKIMNE